MNVSQILRYVILVLSAGAIVLGALVMLGILEPRNLPEQFRFIIGLVVLLYGVYRFVLTYYKKPGTHRHEAL